MTLAKIAGRQSAREAVDVQESARMALGGRRRTMARWSSAGRAYQDIAGLRFRFCEEGICMDTSSSPSLSGCECVSFSSAWARLKYQTE